MVDMGFPFDFQTIKELGVLGVVAFLLVPTGTPDDFLTYAIIGALGVQAWLVITLAVLVVVYYKLQN